MQRAIGWVLASLALLLPVACGKTQNPVTATGTVLVDWDHTKASRAPFAAATVGARTPKDFTLTITPKGAPPFKVTVHVENAPVDFKEGASAVHQTAPVAVKITVKENSGWDLSGKCLDGPNYQMPSVGADGGLVTPAGMVLDCSISEHRTAGTVTTSSWDVATSLTLRGDGVLTVSPSDEVVVTSP